MVRLEAVLKMDLSATGGMLRVPTKKQTNIPPEEKEKNHRLKGDFKREYVGFQDGVFYLTC